MMKNRVLALIVFAAMLAIPVLVAANDRSPRIVVAATASATTVPTVSLPTATPTMIVTLEATPEATPEPTLGATTVVDASLTGDATRGDDLFHHGLNGAPACSNCHSTTTAGKGNALAIGPGLLGIGERAATRVEGETAAQYIENSIRHPGDYVVAGFNDIMYKDFARDYSDQDIADLVAYLLTK